MKKNVIALLLSIAVTAGSITVPAAAAETGPAVEVQEAVEAQEETATEEDAQESAGDSREEESPVLTEEADAEETEVLPAQEEAPAQEENKEEDNTEEAPVPAVDVEEDAEAVETIEENGEEAAPSVEEAVQAGTVENAAATVVEEAEEETEASAAPEEAEEEVVSKEAADTADAGNVSGGEWQEKTETVHHDAEGHYEQQQTGTKTVVDKEAWDEPVKHWFIQCTACNARFDTAASVVEHIVFEHQENGEEASYRSAFEIEYVHHDAETHEEPVYEDVWVEDVAAWDETIHTGIFHYVVDGEYLHDTLATVGDATYYFDSDGYTVSGWLQLDEGWSYFGEDCKRQTGWQDKDGSQRYIDPETGLMVTSQIRAVDSGSYYFNSKGEAFTPGLVSDEGKDYYFTGQEFAKDTWMDLDTGRYYFGDDRAKATGILEKDGEIYPLGDDGAVKYMQWVTVGRNRYYTNDCGSAMAGWRVIDGRKYYFMDERYDSYASQNRGMMMTGFRKINGRKYYFLDSKASTYNEEDKGKLITGWRTISGRRYYFLDSKDAAYRAWKEGVMQTGFHKINGKRYYLLDKKSSAYKGWKEGTMQKGIVKISGKKYFFSGSGVMQGSRIVYVKGNRYFFAGNGVMQKNRWVNFNNHRYYLAGNGKVKTGWYKYKGRWFYFDRYGRMKKGLIRVGGKKYVLGNNGVLTTRKSVHVNGRWYWADSEGVLR